MQLTDPSFRETAARLGFPPEGPAVDQTQRYLDLIEEFSDRYSLVSASQRTNLVARHVVDSLHLLPHLPAGSLVDIGSGNGFPGIVLAIADPGRDIHLVESSKKADFLAEVARQLGLTKVTVHRQRAEELAAERSVRERHDVVVARALGSLEVVLEYAMPYLKVGGSLVTPRGPDGPREVDRARPVAAQLGAGPPVCSPYTLPGDETFHMLVYRKIAATPRTFPRRSGMATKNPLGSV